MIDDETSTQCRVGTVLSVGLGVGVIVGFALGTVVALRLGHDAADAVRSLFSRMAGRNNQVNFELLLQ
ncbi:MAG: hypothetical protein AB7P40_13870 [Chloroflexota bacterium]